MNHHHQMPGTRPALSSSLLWWPPSGGSSLDSIPGSSTERSTGFAPHLTPTVSGPGSTFPRCSSDVQLEPSPQDGWPTATDGAACFLSPRCSSLSVRGVRASQPGRWSLSFTACWAGLRSARHQYWCQHTSAKSLPPATGACSPLCSRLPSSAGSFFPF